MGELPDTEAERYKVLPIRSGELLHRHEIVGRFWIFQSAADEITFHEMMFKDLQQIVIGNEGMPLN